MTSPPSKTDGTSAQNTLAPSSFAPNKFYGKPTAAAGGNDKTSPRMTRYGVDRMGAAAHHIDQGAVGGTAVGGTGGDGGGRTPRRGRQPPGDGDDEPPRTPHTPRLATTTAAGREQVRRRIGRNNAQEVTIEARKNLKVDPNYLRAPVIGHTMEEMWALGESTTVAESNIAYNVHIFSAVLVNTHLFSSFSGS